MLGHESICNQIRHSTATLRQSILSHSRMSRQRLTALHAPLQPQLGFDGGSCGLSLLFLTMPRSRLHRSRSPRYTAPDTIGFRLSMGGKRIHEQAGWTEVTYSLLEEKMSGWIPLPSLCCPSPSFIPSFFPSISIDREYFLPFHGNIQISIPCHSTTPIMFPFHLLMRPKNHHRDCPEPSFMIRCCQAIPA